MAFACRRRALISWALSSFAGSEVDEEVGGIVLCIEEGATGFCKVPAVDVVAEVVALCRESMMTC